MFVNFTQKNECICNYVSVTQQKEAIVMIASQTVDKLDENRVCLQFFWLVQIWTLISTSGTR
ncbi:hypothetical protein ACQKGD_29500, partial [Peribacillus frigoritolerans]|uniref:hypothetical protein n=1 Tax=Peribacillus frigoritolerans TaxID=450367 RepID=UPI003D07B8A5